MRKHCDQDLIHSWDTRSISVKIVPQVVIRDACRKLGKLSHTLTCEKLHKSLTNFIVHIPDKNLTIVRERKNIF